MMDANFKLRLKDKKANDVSLSPGWGYYVEDKKYQQQLIPVLGMLLHFDK